MTTAFRNETTFTVITCPRCSMEFAITVKFEEQRRAKHDYFYCPAGHSQWFPGVSDSQKIQNLNAALDVERTRLSNARKELDYARRAVKANSTRLRKIKERVKNGVCPCCQRTFQNLQRHMHAQHPTYGKSDES